jgi:hypothetical protein
MSAEVDFEEELRLLLGQWDELGIRTERLRARIDEVRGVETAKQYVRRETGGLAEAYRRLSHRQKREGLMLRYSDVFDEESLALAQKKLDALAGGESGEA